MHWGFLAIVFVVSVAIGRDHKPLDSSHEATQDEVHVEALTESACVRSLHFRKLMMPLRAPRRAASPRHSLRTLLRKPTS